VFLDLDLVMETSMVSPSNHACCPFDHILRRRFINAAQDAYPEFIEGLSQPHKTI